MNCCYHRRYLIRPSRRFPWTLAVFLGLGLLGLAWSHLWITVGVISCLGAGWAVVKGSRATDPATERTKGQTQ